MADLNILGEALQPCSMQPKTGYFRDGCCRTRADDTGRHVVCCQVTAIFLEYSKSVGNDLSTPRPEYEFPGLKPGDRWCLCLERWKQAHEAGCAPQVILEATHQSALKLVPLSVFQEHALLEA
ncbi:MAG: DUF2237 domain-containing protein [Blastochloris sp.]|nr:DUF2237 domain-containing protein [Blastochloris sp.]